MDRASALRLIREEHARAVDKFGKFHNAHEGWGVIRRRKLERSRRIMTETMSNKRLLTYQGFLDKYGKRPSDIVFAITQKDTAEIVRAEWVKALGKFAKAYDMRIDGFVIPWKDWEALLRGEMPIEH